MQSFGDILGNNKNKKVYRQGSMTAKLILYDWGWRENILYSSKAKQNEKDKGLLMVEKLIEVFGITNYDLQKFKRKTLRFFRDKSTKVPSPFTHIREREEQD